MQLYYDTFADEVVTEIDEIAPPERYIRVHCGSTNVFTEKWFVGDNKFLDVSYTQLKRKQGFVGFIRREMEKKHNVTLRYITDWTVTTEHYNKMKEMLGDRE